VRESNQPDEEGLRDIGPPVDESGGEARLPDILSFVFDWPNIVTLLGLGSGFLAIYFALNENYPAAMIAMLWAVLADWYDGLVARSMADRTDAQKQYGGHLDSLVDLSTSAVGSAIILLSIGEFSLCFFPGALAIVLAGVLRLAYFDTYGLDKNGAHAGLAIDNSPLAIAGVFLLYGFIDPDVFAAVLYVTVLVMAYLHVAPFRMGKLGGRWYYAVTSYVVILTVVYAFNIWTE
jgi:phosphatidylserine synthase